MQIVHILNPFFYTIFPDLQGKSNDDLVHALEVYYSYGPYKPKVSGIHITSEIAQAGIHGLDLNQDGYRLANVPGKKFGSSHLLAWCYVSWNMAIPEMVSSLQIPFDREYEIAKGMVK